VKAAAAAADAADRRLSGEASPPASPQGSVASISGAAASASCAATAAARRALGPRRRAQRLPHAGAPLRPGRGGAGAVSGRDTV